MSTLIRETSDLGGNLDRVSMAHLKNGFFLGRERLNGFMGPARGAGTTQCQRLGGQQQGHTLAKAEDSCQVEKASGCSDSICTQKSENLDVRPAEKWFPYSRE